MSLALVPVSTVPAAAVMPGDSGPFSPAATKLADGVSSASPAGGKKRGRPKGSTNKKRHVPSFGDIGSAGAGFAPHVIFVKAGEDVSAKIMSFSQHGTRGVCVLSANGAISNVTLRQAATSGGTVTYEGRFEILSLSGSFLLTENGGHRSRTGGLSVSLAGPDGRVLGGGVAGLLTAASPVQIVVGSFNTEGKKGPKLHAPSDPVSTQPKMVPMGGTGPNSPPSRGTLSESSGGRVAQ
uniref:AT-hook motif nuclear-localized protein n=1 Tax=Leersia perrieri TaxID=77586 RepID=A0A0D9XF54_9ORYZ